MVDVVLERCASCKNAYILISHELRRNQIEITANVPTEEEESIQIVSRLV